MKKLFPVIVLASLISQSSKVSAEGTTGPGLDSVFSESVDLTDQQATEANTFMHQGQRSRVILENCEKEGLGKCDPTEIDTKGVVIPNEFGGMLEQNLGRLYGVLFGASSFLTGKGGPQVSVVDKNTDPNATQLKASDLTKDETKSLNTSGTLGVDREGAKGTAQKTTDYCVYGAMGYELIAGMMQQALQGRAIESTAALNDPQLAALTALYESHKARKRTSIYQSVIYGATSACYITRAAASQGRVVMDPMYWAKMTAAAGISTLYGIKAKKHANAMVAVQAVINSLPKAGSCNPWTGTSCFCNEASSKTLYPDYYQEVCVLNQGNFAAPQVTMGCGVMVNGQMTYDEACKCKETGTCFQAGLSSFNPQFSLGKNFMNEANSGYGLLSNGLFDQGKMDTYAFQNGSYAARIKSKTDLPAPKLNADQKKIADSFGNLLPANLAAIAATTPSFSPAGGGLMGESTEAALMKLPEKIKDKVSEAELKANYSQTGSGFGSTAEAEEGVAFPSLGGEAASKSGTEVLSFAEQAISRADVSNSPETPLFDIISNRYRRSGWEKLKPSLP